MLLESLNKNFLNKYKYFNINYCLIPLYLKLITYVIFLVVIIFFVYAFILVVIKKSSV